MRKIAIERQPQNGRAKRDLAWSYYFLGETKIADGSVSSGLDYMEMGLSILNDRIASYPKDSDARSDLISFLNSYISNSNSTNNIARASEKCLGVLVSLQVVVEKNPYNYALADTLSRVQMAFDEMTK